MTKSFPVPLTISKLIQIWSVALLLFWVCYDLLAFVIVEDSLPTQGVMLCILGSLAAMSLVLSTMYNRVVAFLAMAFSLAALMSIIYYNNDILLILFGVVFFILPILLPSLFLLLTPQLFVLTDSNENSRSYFLGLIIIVGLLIIILSGTWFLGMF